MPTKTKSWRQRFAKGKTPLTKVLDIDFAGIKRGQTMLISSPAEIAAYIDKIPEGATRSIIDMRDALAKRHHADATCPVSSAIFLRVAAEAAFEAHQEGAPLDTITPFWRVIEPGSILARKLSCGDAFVTAQRVREGADAVDMTGDTTPARQPALKKPARKR
jgi:hypothetical protein